MTTFSTGGSAVTFTTSGSAVSFAVTAASNAFTTSAVLTPGAHASTHGAGGADPITTLGTVTTTLGTVTTLVAPSATMTAGTASTFVTSGLLTAGSAIVSGSSSGSLVRITQTGTGEALRVEDSANPDSTPFVVLADGKVGIGTAVPTFPLQVIGDIASYDGVGYVILNSGGVAASKQLTLDWNSGTDRAEITSIHTGTSYKPLSIEASAISLGTAVGAQVTTALGAAATPALAFTGDTNTGIYSPGADQVGIATAGTARVVVDGSGNVGVGTTSPVDRLHLAADATFGQYLETGSGDNLGPNIIFRKARGTIASKTVVSSGDFIGNVNFYGYDGSTYRRAALIAAAVDTGAGSADMPGRLVFYTTADAGSDVTERMRIDNAGLITGTGTSLGAWTAFTPTVTAGTGSITTYTASGWYAQIGKIVTCHFKITVTTNGTGATSIIASLPVSVKSSRDPVGAGRETAVVGKMLQVIGTTGAASASILNYDNSYPAGDGYTLVCSLTYEAA